MDPKEENTQNNSGEEKNASSLVDEALLDAQEIQNYIKENSKDMLRSTVSETVNENLKSVLKEEEDEEEEDYEEEEVEDDDEEEGEAADTSGEEDYAGGEGEEEISFDDEGEGGFEAGGEEEYAGGEEFEAGGEEEYAGGEEEYAGGEETFDLTGKDDEEVLNIYKKLSGEDQVEVVGDDEYKLKDDESGQEYKIELGDETGVGEEEEMEYSFEGTDKDGERIYEIELEEGSENTNPKRGAGKETHAMGELSKATEEDPGDERTGVAEEYEEEGEEEVNEDKPRKAGHDSRDQVKGASAPDEIEKSTAPTDTKHHGDNLTGGFPEDEATKDGAGHHAEHVMEDEDFGDIDLESLGEALEDDEKADGTRDLGDGIGDVEEGTGEQDYDYEEDTDYRDEEGEAPGEQGTGPDERTPEEEEGVDENSVRAYNNGRNVSAKPQNFPKQRMAGRDNHFQQARGIGESKGDKTLEKKYEKLKEEYGKLSQENKKFKKALKEFKSTLAETALFNSNLTYATKLFLEHSLSNAEKTKIMERFDREVKDFDDAQKLYETISSELENREPINESIENKIGEKASSSSSSQMKSQNAYANTEFERMKKLMKY